MISRKRLLYVIGIVLTISVIFMIYNFNEEKSNYVRIAQREIEDVVWMENSGEVIRAEQSMEVIITGKGDEDLYKDIYQNVYEIINDLKISYQELDKVEKADYGKNSIIVFCDDRIEPYADLLELGEFIADGGMVIFAAGLSEGDQDSYLVPFLGITEKSIRKNYNEFEFENDLWPLQPEKMNYDGYNMSTWIKVNSDADVYIRDKNDQIPILYTYDYQDGRCCLVNGTLLSDRGCSGILTGAICAVSEDFLYPVVGVKSVFLDNFPMVTYVNDELCMKMYGCITESFVRDVAWPQFQGMGLRTNTVYSSSIIAESAGKESFPKIQEGLFNTIGKSALQHDGELLYSAYAEKNENYYYNEELIKGFNETFVDYKIQGLAVMSDEFYEEMLNIPGVDIGAVRNKLTEKDAFRYTEDYFCFPQGTYGNDMEAGNLLEICSLYAAYGMISHTFDINTLIAEDEDTASWDKYKEQIAVFESEVLSKTKLLSAKTLSHVRDYVKSYDGLNYSWVKNGNEVVINGSDMMVGQMFFYHTQDKLVNVEGARYEDIGNGYYMLWIEEEQVVLTVE